MWNSARFTNGSWELPPHARGVSSPDAERRAAHVELEREQDALRQQLQQVRSGVRHV